MDIYGYHRFEDQHEALLVRVNGQTFKADGTRFFIALSVAPGEQPARCAEIDSDSIEHFVDVISLNGLRLKRYPLWVRKPEKRAA